MITDEICLRLAKLNPTMIKVEDESQMHIGHAGSLQGGHYHLHIVSKCFSGLSLIERHRLIYDLLNDLMHNKIHALSIDAHTSTDNF
ncbi:MAG: BolA family transcriptional regulator [Pseudomonadota bacterium]|nr:BolA family transcriptional regulator [Pseudomonadota bacterium]